MKKFLFIALFFPFWAKGQNIITTVAGSGFGGYSGDGGPATAAMFYGLHGLAFDKTGNMFLSEYGNGTIRKVAPNQIITTYGGQALHADYSGDGGPATAAEFNWPLKMTTDAAGNLYIADFNNKAVRKISVTGIVTTVAGGLGCLSGAGDGDPATSVCFSQIDCVRFDKHGNMYISENLGQRIWKVDITGIASIVAGTGYSGSSGDGGPATAAEINYPTGMAFDTSGNLYFVENNRGKVRKINTAGIITTIAGTGTPGYSGDGGPATNAMLNFPNDVIVDTSGNVFVADTYNNKIRKIDPSGIISTYAGNGTNTYTGDGGPATAAGIGNVRDIELDSLGDMYFTGQSEIVRKIIRFPHTADVTDISSEQIVIGPNPAHIQISIGLPVQIKSGRVLFFNSMGSSVLDCEVKDRVDISSLPNGYYTLKLILDDKIFYKKIVKG